MTVKSLYPRMGLAVFALLLPTAAFAHPGHAPITGFDAGFFHPLSGIDHILAMVTVGMLAANLGGRALWAVPLAFMSLMVIGGIIGMAGIPIPYVEVGIALSVIALGLAVAAQVQWPVSTAMAFVGVFAIFHGHAHGTEMAATMSAVSFALGFILATGILHLVGIGLGTAISNVGVARAKQATQMGGVAIAVAGVGLLATMS